MDKEQLIRELKYTKEKHKNDKLFTFDTDISAMCSDVLDVLSRCVEIPDNATNGEAIKAMFKPSRITRTDDTVNIEYDLTLTPEWWNALYERR